MGNTIKDIANLYAKKQAVMVDDLLESSPILSAIPYAEASHDMYNVFEKVESVTGGGFVDFDGVLPVMNSQGKLDQTSLSIIGGEQEVSVDTANIFGGAEAYFRKKAPLLMKKTGMSSELTIFNKIKQFAIDNSSMLKTTATTGNAYTMMAVRFEEGETYGYYSPKGVRTNGEIMQITPLNGGNLYKLSTGVNGYGVEYRGYFGLQMASTRAVAGITNIQSDKLPTEVQIDQMLIDIRANGNNTFIFCHPQVLAYLKKFKTDKMQRFEETMDVSKGITMWDGIRFVTSFNIGASAFVTIA